MKYLSIIVLSIFAISCSSTKKEAKEEMVKQEAKVDKAMKDSKPMMDKKMSDAKEAMGSAIGDFPMITGTERSNATCGSRIVKVIDREQEKDCGVVYEKAGVAKTVAMAKYDMGFCDKVAENIKSNLSNGGIACDAAAAAAPAEETAQ